MFYECIILTPEDTTVHKTLSIRPTLDEVLVIDSIAYQVEKIINDNGKRLWLFCYAIDQFPFDSEAMYKEVISNDTI